MKRLVTLVSLALCMLAPSAFAGAVGFREVSVPNGTDAPLTVGIWYPTAATPAPAPLGTFTQVVAVNGAVADGIRAPLVVMSHGNGGWYGGHYDTALALAQAGFIVAAVSHTGDTYDDQSRSVRMADRPRHLKRLIDFMLKEWSDRARVDADRIGAFGFSSGGFTVLVAAGGTPDMGRVAPHCQAHPDYFDCGLVRKSPEGARMGSLSAAVWTHDARIRAAVVAAPALGFTFGSDGLKGVREPIQLWRDLDDHILPNPDYAEAVRANLPAPPEMHLVEHADHFDFLAPCDDRLAHIAPAICRSEPGFDRAAFHAAFNRDVVRFFQEHLR